MKLIPTNFTVGIFYFLSPALFAMGGPDEKKLTAQESIAIAADILEKNAQEFRAILELSVDAALYLFDEKTAFDTGNRINDELVKDAFHWMGGAINYGHEHYYPVGAREDKRFQAMHLVRAATFYTEWYFTAKAVSLALKSSLSLESTLKSSLSVETINDIVVYCENLIARVGEQYSNLRPQTEEEKLAFGEFPSTDLDGLIRQPWTQVVSHLKGSVEQLKAAGGEPLANHRLWLNIINGLSEKTLELDNEFYQLTISFIGFQYAKNGNKPAEVADEHRRELALFFRKTPKERNIFLNKRISLKLSKLLPLIKDIDETLIGYQHIPFKLLEVKSSLDKNEGTSEQQTKREDKGPTKKKKKKHKKKKKVAALANPVLPKDNDESVAMPSLVIANQGSDESSVRDEQKSTESGAYDKLEEADVRAEIDEQEVNISSVAKPATSPISVTKPKSKRQRKAEKKRERAISRQPNVAQAASSSVTALSPNEYLTQEVVEKFLDIFGNRLGERQKKKTKSYQCQGWGLNDDFVSTLKAAGWLVNKRQTALGTIINEKHSSSTLSFQMPKGSMKNIYLKFHGDHESKLAMREIARHFIIKHLEEAGYPEAFWQQYHESYFNQ